MKPSWTLASRLLYAPVSALRDPGRDPARGLMMACADEGYAIGALYIQALQAQFREADDLRLHAQWERVVRALREAVAADAAPPEAARCRPTYPGFTVHGFRRPSCESASAEPPGIARGRAE